MKEENQIKTSPSLTKKKKISLRKDRGMEATVANIKHQTQYSKVFYRIVMKLNKNK
jgi:hypothetical protein